MAIKTITNLASAAGIPTGTITAGIDTITQASAEASAGTIVRAKDGKGDIVGVLVGKKVITMSVSGYSSVQTGAKLNDAITVGTVAGVVTSASIESTAEDFTKFSAQGRAISGGIV